MSQRSNFTRHRAIVAGGLLAFVLISVLVGATAEEVTINMNPNNTFDPPSKTVKVGDTVTWENKGGTHSAVPNPGQEDPFTPSPALSVGKKHSIVISGKARTIKYHCGIHGAAMSGELVVVAAPVTINMNPNNTFEPASLTVKVGDTVTWENKGGTHSVVPNLGQEDPFAPSPVMSTVGAKHLIVISGKARTIKYHCGIHGAAMSGELVVAPDPVTISINPNNTFGAPSRPIKVGDTVVWENKGGTHSVIPNPGQPDPFMPSPVLSAVGAKHSIVISGAPRTIKYHCGIHGAGMSGELVIGP